MTLQVWRGRCSGYPSERLCQRAELTPAELRSLLMRMGHALARFQRERGMTLPRPVAANSPLQSYFVDPDFAAVAASQMFGESRRGPAGLRRGAPLMASRRGALGEPTVHRLWIALTIMVCLMVMLACGWTPMTGWCVDTPDAWRTPTPPCIS